MLQTAAHAGDLVLLMPECIPEDMSCVGMGVAPTWATDVTNKKAKLANTAAETLDIFPIKESILITLYLYASISSFSAVFRSTAFTATKIDDNDIRSAANSGLKERPYAGYNTPAAIGIAARL